MFFPPEVVMEAVHVGKPTDEWYPWENSLKTASLPGF